MPGTKRTINSPQRQAKKSKRDPIADKLSEVMVEMGKAGVSKDLEKMIDLILPLSLGEFSDQRHRFQEEVVEGLAGLLGEREAALKADVAGKRSQCDVASTDRPLRSKQLEDENAKLKAQKEEVQRLKVALADKAMAFRAARSALAEAEEAKVLDGEKVRDAEKKRKDFVTASEDLAALKTLLPEDADTKKKEKELMTLIKKYKFEESMLIALPAALSKAPDARGQFDLMAITQLEAEIDKRVKEQDAILAAAAPGQAKCEAAIKDAQDRLSAARGEQRSAAKLFDDASEGQASLERSSAVANQAVKDVVKQCTKTEKALHAAEVEVELFEQGPRETFQELRARTTPPPAAEVQVEEEAAPEPMAEEPASELPVAVAA